MAKLGIIRTLKASHGSNVHEHEFVIEFVFEGPIVGDMVHGIDFHVVSKIIDEELEKLSGKYLNEFLDRRVTVETLGIYLLNILDTKVNNTLYAIKIFEEFDRYIEILASEVRG